MVLTQTGFFGADGKSWPWVGQIADDSTWRDNKLPGKFKSAKTIPGWGDRYKVRIMGIHDQSQETIPDDQLPWATIEFPVTGGSGQGNQHQSANLTQGMFVSGYFMDGAPQQVPVITGVLGNNAQTAMTMATGMTGGEAFTNFSGFSETKLPYKGSSKPKVPAEGLVIGEESADTADPPPGSTFDQYGLPSNLPRTPSQLAAIANALQEGESLSGASLNDFVKGKLAKQKEDLKAAASLASAGPIANATLESVSSLHQLSAGDLQRERKFTEKIVVMKPDDIVGSSMKAIQTVTENLSNELSYVQDALRSYTGAVSAIGNPAADMKKLIGDAACQLAKYMKIIFDKVMNYVLKILNKGMTKVVSSLPSSMRYQFSDMKEVLTELTLCMYGKMTNGLCGVIAGMLEDMLNPDKLEEDARNDALNPDATSGYVDVPICTAEEMVGEVLSMHQAQINDANNSLVDNINSFLDDVQSQLAGISGMASDVMSKMGGISGSMTAALGFANIKLNVFGCELKPSTSMADFYTLARGGASGAEQQIPSSKAIENRAQESPKLAKPVSETPFVVVPKGQQEIRTDDSDTTQVTEEDWDDAANASQEELDASLEIL